MCGARTPQITSSPHLGALGTRVEQQWMFNLCGNCGICSLGEPKSSEAQRGWKTVRLATARLMSCTEMDMHEINNFLSMKELLEFRTEEFTEKTGYSLRDIERKLAELVERRWKPISLSGCMVIKHYR